MTKKLYTHTTSGGAQYLMDTFIDWKHNGKSGKEGTVNENTRLLIRMDGKQPELIHNEAEEERAELLKALEALINIFDDRNHAGTNVDGMWMGVPDWENVEAARAAIAKAKGE